MMAGAITGANKLVNYVRHAVWPLGDLPAGIGGITPRD